MRGSDDACLTFIPYVNENDQRLMMCSYVVIDPPEQPTISGYIDGRSVYAGNVLSLTCTSVGGNPPATLTWLKGHHSLRLYHITYTGNGSQYCCVQSV